MIILLKINIHKNTLCRIINYIQPKENGMETETKENYLFILRKLLGAWYALNACAFAFTSTTGNRSLKGGEIEA
jgi:hypothetical protein